MKIPDPVGQKIVACREMKPEEFESEGWEDHGHIVKVIVLESGVKLYASRDEEGNGPGCMFGSYKGKQFCV